VEPASNFPESALTPATLVTEKLGKPDQVLHLKGNALFSWWRYGNTAYMIASLAADRPGHDYIATKSCDWSLTQKRAGIGNAQFGEYLDAGSLVGLFQANGLPVGRYQVYNASTDPNHLLGRPGLYTSKVNFVDTRIDQSGYAGEKTIDTNQGGSVEVFGTEDDAKQRADYVRSITRGSAIFAEYSYLRGRVFLRLSKELTPKQAKAYDLLMRKLPAAPPGE
jgi:hypothetical protein